MRRNEKAPSREGASFIVQSECLHFFKWETFFHHGLSTSDASFFNVGTSFLHLLVICCCIRQSVSSCRYSISAFQRPGKVLEITAVNLSDLSTDERLNPEHPRVTEVHRLRLVPWAADAYSSSPDSLIIGALMGPSGIPNESNVRSG